MTGPSNINLVLYVGYWKIILEHKRIVGLIDVPGYGDKRDTYGSESIGFYGILMAVDMLVEIGGISGAHKELGCDGLSTLNRSF